MSRIRDSPAGFRHATHSLAPEGTGLGAGDAAASLQTGTPDFYTITVIVTGSKQKSLPEAMVAFDGQPSCALRSCSCVRRVCPLRLSGRRPARPSSRDRRGSGSRVRLPEGLPRRSTPLPGVLGPSWFSFNRHILVSSDSYFRQGLRAVPFFRCALLAWPHDSLG